MISELPIAHYRTLMAAVDSPIGAPIKPAITDLRNAYRDPTRFRYSAIERPTIEPAKTINLLTGKMCNVCSIMCVCMLKL